MYICIYVCGRAKHARAHRFNANSAPKEDEAGFSAGVVRRTLQPSHPLLGGGLQDLASTPPPVLLAPSSPPALRPGVAMASSRPPRRCGDGRGEEPLADSGLSRVPCACSSADVSTPSLYREVSVWSVQTFILLFFFTIIFILGKKSP